MLKGGGLVGVGAQTLFVNLQVMSQCQQSVYFVIELTANWRAWQSKVQNK